MNTFLIVMGTLKMKMGKEQLLTKNLAKKFILLRHNRLSVITE